MGGHAIGSSEEGVLTFADGRITNILTSYISGRIFKSGTALSPADCAVTRVSRPGRRLLEWAEN